MSDNHAERMAEAEAARAAWDRFVGPAVKKLTAEYTEVLINAASAPLTNDGRATMEKASLAIKVLDKVQAHLAAIVYDGEAARQQHNFGQQIAQLPAEKKRWALM